MTSEGIKKEKCVMCRPASFVVVKGPKAFWSRTKDGHTAIRSEFILPENGTGRVTSVQIEIVPDGNDFALPLNDWNFYVDQSDLPEWWNQDDAEKECRIELEKWAKARLVRAGERRDVKEGEYVTAVYGGTVNEVRGGTVNEVRGGTVNKVRGGTVNEVWSGTVNEVWGGTVNKVCGGTVCFFRKFKCKLRGMFSVIIDRTGVKARCVAGTDKTTEVTSE